jgi:hypothetical protein
LDAIPLFDLGDRGPEALIDAAPERFAEILGHARRYYGGLTLRAGDVISRRWLVRTGNPYSNEIAGIAAAAGRPGAYLLNLSYEWSCTAAVGGDPDGGGNRLLRTLDWPLDGLGRAVCVAKTKGAAGAYYNVTWPGFSGVATVMAPGRFSAALNQPPMRKLTPSYRLDWLISRLQMRRAAGLPPVHLLRLICDTCPTYAEARKMLENEPLCAPALFSLAGAEASEGCVIERLERKAVTHCAPATIANHWLAIQAPGHDRGMDSRERFRRMEQIRERDWDDFSWVAPPILNQTTRVSVIANAGNGSLAVQGWEAGRAVTEIFRL